MAIDERPPTLLSATKSLQRGTNVNRNGLARGATRTFSSLSVSGVTSSTSKDVFDRTLDFVMLDAGLIEVYASFSGTIGAGNTLTLSMVMDGTSYQVLQWTGSVTNQVRYSTPADLAGTTATRGGFQVRLHNLSAGYHTLQFTFTASGGTGSASSGVISYRFS